MKKLVLAVLACLMMSACGGSKAPSVDKKTKDEYSGEEVYKLLKKNGYDVTNSYSGIIIGNDEKPVTLMSVVIDGKFENVLYSGKENTYFINEKDAKDDMASIQLDKEGENFCFYDVEEGKSHVFKDSKKESTCDKVDADAANEVYVEFYEFLNENDLSRGEIITFVQWYIKEYL